MKFDLKSVIAGLILGAVVTTVFGFVGQAGQEEKPVVTIREATHLALVEDKNGNAVVINVKTGKADWVTYTAVNPPRNTVLLAK